MLATRVGYTGGKTANPTYLSIGDHTEAVAVEFDPKVITYKQILGLFFEWHSPYHSKRAQYRSAIWYHNESQKAVAEEAMADKVKTLPAGRELHTALEPANDFYLAEEYHQKYYAKQGRGMGRF